MSLVSLLSSAVVLLLASAADATACPAARRACLSAAHQVALACRERCQNGAADCQAACRAAQTADREACRAADPPCVIIPADVGACRRAARGAGRACRQACRADIPAARTGCVARCRLAHAHAESGCGYAVATTAPGTAVVPMLPEGRPADLTLLDSAEQAVIAAADARADALRRRPVRLWIGRQGAAVHVAQTRHAFPFGFPIDLRRFASDEERDWYAETMAAHFGLVVIENTQKWAGIEPSEGTRVYDAADADVAWAEGLGLPIKGHAAMWGIVPPFSSSGVPAWALERFATTPLVAAEAAALRTILRRHVLELVGRYRGRLAVWDATNETLQPFAQWFVQRLGEGIVADVFRWAHEADPDARLVFNEWIVEVFTGLPSPTATDVRDRVLALRAAGVPIHAVGQQAHFVPAAAFAGAPVDLSQRTRLDAYAAALDTLAAAGLPIHITETNVIAPDDPELRAAQAEGLMRLWWGHPAVEQIVFWGPWNKVAGRDEFDVGLWDDDRNLSRHGEAVLSLLNTRWRTAVDAVTDPTGAIEFSATHGEHVAEWLVDGIPVHARFTVRAGDGTQVIAVVGP